MIGRKRRPASAAHAAALSTAPAGVLSSALTALLAALLVGAALALVISQYRSRQLFAELELAQQEAKALTADGARLRADLGRAAQPATVEAVARRLGMRAINPDRVVMLPARSGAAGAVVPLPADSGHAGQR
jgi:cell division protein FtsL